MIYKAPKSQKESGVFSRNSVSGDNNLFVKVF